MITILQKPKSALFASLLLSCVLSVGCSSDVADPIPAGSTGGTTGEGSTDGSSSSTGGAQNNSYSIQLNTTSIDLTEGKNVSVIVNIVRGDGHTAPVKLAADGQTGNDKKDMWWQFTDDLIEGGETGTSMLIGSNIGALPIKALTKRLRVIGTDGSRRATEATIDLQIKPTNRPDVYLLIGQSNMVGFSEANAKQAQPGGQDAVVDAIQQLNVTGNDSTNFNSAAAFVDINRIAVGAPRLTPAIDPLHDGYDAQVSGKAGTRVGLGLRFAKEALPNTTTSIFLVPAAWSNTGFCKKSELYNGGLGWNVEPLSNPAFAGTLLYQRAIARANLALDETQGILRGILWHQGEADSETRVCAENYEQNLLKLVKALRMNIAEDARGPGARSESANVPFVVGTMSQGGDYADLSDTKKIVDQVHREISSKIPYSALANGDDLVPPSYDCGDGDCIHYGSLALRELGVRYYQALIRAASR